MAHMGGWKVARAVFVVGILLGSFLILPGSSESEDLSDAIIPELKKILEKSKDKSKPAWNSHKIDWTELGRNGSIRVIIAFDELDLKNLDKKLQREIDKQKKHELTLGFTGVSTVLDSDTIIQILEANPQIQIQPDYPVSASVNVNQTGADALWNRTDISGWPLKGKGITVAVIDTGIDYNHPDLGGGFGAGYRVIGGWDFVNNDANPMDDHGHGTHCAGIVGANGSIFGMAPEVEFYAYKVLDATGGGYTSDVIEGIERAMDPNDDGDTSDHADILSMSLGGVGSPDDAACMAVEAAVAGGAVVCVAAGNRYYFGTVDSPGYARSAVTVGSITVEGVRSEFSSHGTTPYRYSKPEISAPGSSIYSCYLYSGYRTWSGTSMATPHVAGAAAQILQDHPDWEPWMVKSALVTGVRYADDAIWRYGAGALWVPNATDEVTFSDVPLASYGWDYGVTYYLNIQNNGTARNYSISCDDWHSVWGNHSINGTVVTHTDVGALGTVQSYLDLAEDSVDTIEMTFAAPAESWPEGYYEGFIHLSNNTHNLSIPVTHMVMSEVNVQVLRRDGGLLQDSTGTVNVFDTATCDIQRIQYATTTFPVPPYRTHVPSGDYMVEIFGHMLFYSYSDPYFLHGEQTVSRLANHTLYLNLATAKQAVLNLSTPDDHPIYVKEVRYYWRYAGIRNLSYDRSVGDYSIVGAEYFTLPKQVTFYVSETSLQGGFDIIGYAYSDPLYQFMYNNYDHWYEWISGTSTAFNIASTTDLQYLLSWEWGAINATDTLDLSINWSRASAYSNHYDTPGWIYDPWCNWINVRAAGGGSALFSRRDTGSAIEPFFTGMNRTVIVQGPHLEWFASMGLFEGLSLPYWGTVDWAHQLNTTTNNVFIPDPDYYGDYPQGNESYRIGTGPMYVSAYMLNTNTSLKIHQPLFSDIYGLRFAPAYSITWKFYRGGSMLAIYQMPEAGTKYPEAYRYVELTSTGWYHARIENMIVTDVMGTKAVIDWGFLVPNIDVTPPRILEFSMPRKFVATDALDVSMTLDDEDTITPGLWWRNGVTDAWNAVSLTPAGGNVWDGSVATLAGTTMIDLMLNISDVTGNYLNYTMHNVSRVQIDVDFNISVFGGTPDIPYRNSEQSITLVGYLTTGGSALHSYAGVPIDLFVEGVKVATLMDENITVGAHTHNGTIQFEWGVDPTKIFSGPGESKTVSARFDLGIYEALWSNFTVNSIAANDEPPYINLNNPANNTALLMGSLIDFDITDEALVSADYAWDNGTVMSAVSPYFVPTTGLSDGYHWVRVNATDANTTSSYSFRFWVDDAAPTCSIDYPTNGTSIPAYTYINGTASSSYASPSVYWEVEGQLRTVDYVTPYQLSTGGWAPGWYNVTLYAYDSFGHYSVAQVNFNITTTAPVITNVPSLTGTQYVEYEYNATCTEADSGVNSWDLETNATWMNLNYSDETHGFINGISGAYGWFWVNISVSDGDSTDYNNYTLTIEEAGTPPAPSITSTALTGAREDHLYSYAATSDQAIDTWTGYSNATWLTFTSANATFWGTPDNAVSEWDFWANVSCENANGSSYQNFSIHVWNLAPAFTPDLGSPPTTGVVGREIVYDANHSDEGIGVPPGNTTVLETNFTGYYSFDEASGTLTFTPTYAGELWWNLTGNDQRGMDNSTTYQNWTMTIEEKAPYIISSPIAATTVWELFFFNCTSTPADSGISTWAYESNATWLSFVWGNQTLYNVSGTPTELGSYYVNFSISDDDSDHYLNFTLSVVAGPAPVFISTPPLIAWEDHLYFYQALCDQPIDTWSLLFNNATWTTWNPANGSFIGTPDNSHVREYYCLYISGTNMNGTVWQSWWPEVHNNIPIFSTSGTLTATNGSAYSYDAGTSDEGTIANATYTVLTNATFGYSIGSSSGHLNFTPDCVGSFWFNITFVDGTLIENGTIFQNFTVIVSASSPIIDSSPTLTVTVWTLYLALHHCTSPDSGPTDWGHTTDADWLSFLSGGDGTDYYNLSGTPTAVGSYWLNITVEDGDSSSYLNFSIEVQIGPAPTFTTTPGTEAWEDHPYVYEAEASTLYVLWSHESNASWLVIAASSVSGTPTNAYAEKIFFVNLTISNMNGTAYQNWSISVPNNPPILSGTPSASAYVGSTYSFDAECTDEGHGTVVYNVTTNSGFWYLVNDTTGLLLIIPTSIGTYWFNLTFNDNSGAANATTYLNFTVTFSIYSLPDDSDETDGSHSVYPSFTYIVIDMEVSFTHTSYGDIASVYWDFGDGTGSSALNPVHKYRMPGTYEVTLSIVGIDGETRNLSTRISVGLDSDFQATNEGWRLLMPGDFWLTVSALGLFWMGISFWISSYLFPEVPIITKKGRRVVGLLLILGASYYFVFINNGWLP